MAEEVYYTGYQYRLRAGSPMPIEGVGGNFVLHTFKAEMTKVENYLCTSELPLSSEFRGQGGELISANFTRLQDIGGNTFQGSRVYNPSFVEEDELDLNF